MGGRRREVWLLSVILALSILQAPRWNLTSRRRSSLRFKSLTWVRLVLHQDEVTLTLQESIDRWEKSVRSTLCSPTRTQRPSSSTVRTMAVNWEGTSFKSWMLRLTQRRTMTSTTSAPSSTLQLIESPHDSYSPGNSGIDLIELQQVNALVQSLTEKELLIKTSSPNRNKFKSWKCRRRCPLSSGRRSPKDRWGSTGLSRASRRLSRS